ncbi:probable G-protein coupled receptor 149 isoform X1 [Solea solea]|uniref:probable G-protein coupled receptor 149 isoform X1 n=1 Tax=Solea solea TaxID=90069 RepID=UPI00272BC06C|nr:probable G-protein coupled receptor 149 isoform X1 [Solea solea]
MSTTLNQSLSTDTNDKTDRHVRLLLFGLCVTIAAATLVGGLYSLVSLLRSWRKNPLCVIVASMSVDDLLSVAPLSMFLLLQWETDGADDGGGGGGGGRGRGSSRLCTVSGLLYVFQGVSSHMKACLIAAYTFYVSRKFGVFGSVRTPVAVTWAVVGVWSVSLSVSVLPLCGWGTFTPLTLGCFPDTSGVYVMLLFSLYSLSFCGLLIFFVPLTHELLCSTEPHRILLSPACVDMSRGHGASAHSCPRDSVAKSFGAYNELSPSSCATERRGTEDSGLSPDSVRGTEDSGMSPDSVRGTEDSGLSPDSVRGTEDSGLSPDSVRGQRTAAVTHAPRLFAQKRFSMIVALLRVVLWMPMMRWIHMPCGCFINCKQDPHQQSSVMKRRLDIRLSFHQNCGVYKLSHHSLCLQKPDCYTLFNCHPLHSHLDTLQRGSGLAPGLDFSTTCPADSSSRAELLLDAAETVSDLCPDVRCVHVFPPHQREREDTDVSSVFDGPDRRVSHEDCGTMQLTDWEWCRSKSERTSRQRSSGGLSVPLCAFQGTISLQAPTGKTLSLSTYEVSSDGLTICPNSTKKVEVYRSKSVGHEPRADDPVSSSSEVDTNVKIHLEVLEICDNEEAMDSVSIISNISQSSTHARSPSLRYSRRENRFISCDLAESASYSLLIPTSGNPDTETMSITIPDTVEAHRHNSRRQTRHTSGYHEEIQMINEAYDKQSEDRKE